MSKYDVSARGARASTRQHVEARRAHGSESGFRDVLKQLDDAFSRTFMAAAMAEDGTRELALERLEDESTTHDG